MKRRTSIFAFAMTIPFSLLLGCLSNGQDDIQVPEFHSIEPAPMLAEPISQDSKYAALRYIALGQEFETSNLFNRVYIEKTTNGLKAFQFSDDEDVTNQYTNWLVGIQPTLNSVQSASELNDLFPYSGDAIFNMYRDGDPRKQHISLLRKIATTQLHDSTRLWFSEDHTNSIERVNSVLRVAVQLSKPGYFDPMNPILANAVAMTALDQYKWMLQQPTCTPEDRNTIEQSLELLDGNDPLHLNRSAGLYILSIDNWMNTQLKFEGGSDEFWYHFGMIHGVTRLTESLFKLPFDIDTALSNIEETRRELLEYLEDIEFDDIKHAYEEYHPIAIEIGTSLTDGTTTQERLSHLLTATEDDETGMSDTMMLSFGRSAFRNTQRLTDLRDELRELTED